MQIASAASAFPEHYYSQKFLLEKLQEYWGHRLRNPLMLARLHRNVAVEGRHLSMSYEKYYDLHTWGCANDVWIRVAQELGEQALCRALHHAGVDKRALGALFFASVTGICSPSVDALLVNRMELPANIKRVPIFGLGCVAGAAGIARAADYVRAYPSQAAALVSVELCSLTIQRDDLSVANLISSGLFADGSAAVIVTGNGIQHRAVSRGTGANSRKSGQRRRCVPRRSRIQKKRCPELGAAHRRSEGSGGYSSGAGFARWGVGCIVGLSEESWELVVCVRAGCARGCDEEPTSRTGDDWNPGSDGARVLLRVGIAEVVRMEIC